MRFLTYGFLAIFVLALSIVSSSCSLVTYSTVSAPDAEDSLNVDPEPDYSRTLDYDFQDFTSYLYMGNRVENFTAYFNKYFKADEDFEDALEEYRTSFIATYNRRLDSLGVTPPVSATVKEKLDKSIERASKVIQFHKSSKYIDDAVLLIGKAYYFQTDYVSAERKFNEFLSKLSNSDLADEALLYLGRTKLKLRNRDEGYNILNTLMNESDDNEIKSLAARDLAILAYNSGDLGVSVDNFKKAIQLSDDNVRKAENQFILARLSSVYKPETAADEFKKVLEYSPDFDLTFFARLNFAKGLIRNKDYDEASDELESMRKKYRDFKDFTPLIDLEIANNLYSKGDLVSAKNKYYEVIVKYPNTTSSSDAYYFLGKDFEDKHKDYLNALVNYKKAAQENSLSEFYPQSVEKTKTLERYFELISSVNETTDFEVPLTNPEVEKYRAFYNEEQGIEQLEDDKGIDNRGVENTEGNTDTDGDQRGDGKGKPGGFRELVNSSPQDSLEDLMKNPNPTADPDTTKKGFNPGSVSDEESGKLKEEAEKESLKQDSIEALNVVKEQAEQENKRYDSFYELAELFMYSLNDPDSALHYLNLLIDEYPEPARKAKSMFMLGTFYKSTGKDELAEETFAEIIAEFPATVYANESRVLLKEKALADTTLMEESGDLLTQAVVKFNEDNYSDAINLMREYSDKNPTDSMSAKALYGIGWIYENKLLVKDSAIAYYKLLKLRFPDSQYYINIAPTLDYFASLEQQNSDSTTVAANTSDSLKSVNGEDGEENTGDESVILKEPEGKLTQEQLEQFLLRGESK